MQVDINMKLAWWEGWIKSYKNVYDVTRNSDQKPVDFFKTKLGPQTRCDVLGSENRRFWIWEFDGWTLLVNNIKGYIIEVDHWCEEDQAQKYWHEFLGGIGLWVSK